MALKRSILSFLIFLFCAFRANAQLTVDTNYTVTQLVENVLLGNSVTVSNIKYTGAHHAIGYFNGTKSNIGLANGVIMTTGNVEVATKPYNPADRGVNNGLPGDSMLTVISGDSTFDACILEFDFVPYSDTVSFDFVFGSEEYPNFTCCKVNDVFAFFISGPGIVGQKNVALVPGTSTPISINTVNGNCTGASLCGGSCCNSNSKYYIDNTSGTTVGYGGFTTPIKAVCQVQCGQSYHIRIAIADAHDGFYDSGVFLGGGTFRGGVNPMNIVSVPFDSICPNDKVSVSFPINDGSDIYNWSFDGGIVESGTLGGPYIVSWPTSGLKTIKMLMTGACAYNNDSIVVNVNPCDVIVPNVFTPGSGDKNEVFFIGNLDKYPNTNLKVFNRWGEIVYSSSAYNNTWNGNNLPDGTYYYLLTLANRESKQGFVTILRK